MSAINATPLLLGGEGYQISRSVRLRSSASAYFNRTPASAGNRRTWTWSGWVKRGKLAANSPFINAGLISGTYYYTQVYFDTSDCLVFANYSDSNTGWLTTAQVFRDPSAWYHIVVVYDSTNATSTDRMRVHVNGTRVTNFIAGSFPVTYPSQNVDSMLNTTSYANNIGKDTNGGGGAYLDGYLTEVNFIDGQALTPASFGETDAVTGVWKPKKYAGTYGTNGFYLNFSDNSAATAATIGKDYSGNGNNWTPNNISVTGGVTYDSMLDVPTLWADGGNGRGNYAVISPIDKASNIAVAQGNLNVTNSGGSTWASVRGSAAVSSGKWYWEIDQTYSSGGPLIMGIADAAFNVFTQRAGDTAGSYVLAIDGNKGNNGTFGAYAGGSIASGRNIGVALDLDTGTLVFYNNGVSLGTAYSGISGTFFPVVSVYGTQGGTANFNFGQRPFAYTPPAGFKALNTQNLPEPTIKKGNQYFDATTYAGNGAARTITNNGAMQPDLVWVKNRSGANNHVLFDSIRGFGSGKELSSNLTGAENAASSSLYGFVSASTSSGFSVAGGTDPTYTYDLVNAGTANYVAWQWKESISAGFDIVTYTQSASTATVNHSLGVAPKMIIVKDRTGSGTSWYVYHASIGAGNFLTLNSTAAQTANTGIWNNTAPTSSVFSWGPVWSPGDSIVAYLFAEVAGFSKFGSYTGNGSADGPFVFCGFRPRWVMIKRTDVAGNWIILDAARNVSNEANAKLYPNLSNAEDLGAAAAEDFLSNGFKLRATWQDMNQNGATYIFAAFAESPFKNSLAR